MTLYKLDGELRRIIESGFAEKVNEDGYAVDGETGEYWDSEALEALEGARKDKQEGVAVFIKEYTAEVEAYKAEEKALKTRRERLERRVEWLKGYLLTSLDMAGETGISTAKVSVSTRKTKSVNIIDEGIIPAEYMREKIERSPDKALIKKALDGGEAIPGAEIIEKKSIIIK